MITPEYVNHEPDVRALPVVPHRRLRRFLLPIFVIDVIVLVGVCAWYLTLAPARDVEAQIEIREGSRVRAIAASLERAHVIRSRYVFEALVRYYKLDSTLPSGLFIFPPGLDVFDVVHRLARHERGIERIKVTIPEGLSSEQIADTFVKALPHFDAQTFLSFTMSEGAYIFPETYFFFSTATSGEVFLTMQNEFEKRTKTLQEKAREIGKEWRDIVVMASIIEEEAIHDADRKLVSGVLWNRMKLGMRLQVDASFSYLFGKSSKEVTADDLNVDSPYNTYRYAGLPPGPLSHPGIATLEAALFPTASSYLYYLSDADGNMHYARTFAEHKENKAQYLR